MAEQIWQCLGGMETEPPAPKGSVTGGQMALSISEQEQANQALVGQKKQEAVVALVRQLYADAQAGSRQIKKIEITWRLQQV